MKGMGHRNQVYECQTRQFSGDHDGIEQFSNEVS